MMYGFIVIKVKCTIQNHLQIVQRYCDACWLKKISSHQLIKNQWIEESHPPSLHFCSSIIQLKNNEIQKSELSWLLMVLLIKIGRV